jgi:A/G-specific adenine glycosylase
MRSQDAAFALVVRNGERDREVLLHQRPADQTVMPGMWELPTLRNPEVPATQLRMTLRHAIMQVNYYVRIRTVFEEDVEKLALHSKAQRWVRLCDLTTLPLTGLARKVLLRAGLAELAPAFEKI